MAEISGSLQKDEKNHCKKTKADGSGLIPRKHTETLVLLSVADRERESRRPMLS